MPSRTIKGSKKIQTWVVHHNCSNSCNHCFLGGASPDDALLDKTRETTARLESMGYDTRILPTDQTREEYAFLDRYARHSVPNLQVRSRKLDDNLQSFEDTVGVTPTPRFTTA